MNVEQLQETIAKHQKWLADEEGGERANLRGADLRDADLRDADLRDADLTRADLTRANLTRANLTDANLTRADLTRANLRGANLRGADLRDADLTRADLTRADLSGCKGIQSSRQWFKVNIENNNFTRDELGIIVYKAIGNTHYTAPDGWTVETGSFLEEIPNPLRTVECACGVNFGTRQYVQDNHSRANQIWKCRIHWLDMADVIVPFNTDGKARCARLELIEDVTSEFRSEV